jgi:hypothetical protein
MKSILIFALACGLLVSCNPQRRIQKAIKEVTYNDTAFNHVGRLWERFNPCANDTIIDYDTIIEPIDAELNADSLRRALCDSTKPTVIIQPGRDKVIRVPVPCNQTTIKATETIIDTRHLNILRDSLNWYKSAYVTANAERTASQNRERDLNQQLVQVGKSQSWAVTKRTLLMLIPILILLAILIFGKRIGIL